MSVCRHAPFEAGNLSSCSVLMLHAHVDAAVCAHVFLPPDDEYCGWQPSLRIAFFRELHLAVPSKSMQGCARVVQVPLTELRPAPISLHTNAGQERCRSH
eukprot:jgi/Ulvmu1/2566/UM014_0017.1